MNHLKWICGVIVLVMGFIVAVQNYNTLVTPVMFKVDLYFASYQTVGMPLSLVAIITFLVGLISAWLYGITERFRLKKEIKELKKVDREKDNELNSLRNLPVTGEPMDKMVTEGASESQ